MVFDRLYLPHSPSSQIQQRSIMDWDAGVSPNTYGCTTEKAFKRVRTQSIETDVGVLPPPPDCPPYLHAEYMPPWVGRPPKDELTPETVDELHHAQWNAWKESQDYARILEAAPPIFNSSFTRLNPHNFGITVGLTAEALYRTGASPLCCANTLLYGLSLLTDNPSKASLPIQFCGDSASIFMEAWAQEAFGQGPEALEQLFEFCDAYPYTGLPNVLGRRLQYQVDLLLREGKPREGMEVLKRVLRAQWAQEYKVWDSDVYWRLRLLSYICRWRTQHQEGALPKCNPVCIRMVVAVFLKSRGKLPKTFAEGSEEVECGQEFNKEQLLTSLANMKSAFDLFSESFLALSNGLVQWELIYKPSYILQGACMPARAFHRETQSPTTPTRFVAQADVEACPEFKAFVNRKDDEDIMTAQAVMVLWPGLRPAGKYMTTCGGITPDGYKGRMVYMSDGMMLEGRPVWSGEWLHHETFHAMEHLFPESTFSAMSDLCAHPCFLRDQWPPEYEGHYEWDFSYFSYRWIFRDDTKPTLAERISRIPGLPYTYTLDVNRPNTGAVIARLCKHGDTVSLTGHGALTFRPGNCPQGLQIRFGTPENGQSVRTGIAAWWVSDPRPEYVLTVAALHEGPEAHIALVKAYGKDARSLLEQWPCEGLETDCLVPVSGEEVRRRVHKGECTVLATGRSWVEQPWFRCVTCKERGGAPDGLGCCESCARQCHLGHKLEQQRPSPFYCDCGLGSYPFTDCEASGLEDSRQLGEEQREHVLLSHYRMNGH